MRKSMIDIVSKGLSPNTGLVYITVFGSRSTVMVCNARTKRLVAIVTREHDGMSADDIDSYRVKANDDTYYYGRSLSQALATVTYLKGYVQGANQNYSKAQYKEGIAF